MSTNLVVFDGFLTVCERSLEVVHRAAPHGRPTIVFLHEGLGSIALWRDFPARLADAARCGALIYSRYGNGKSQTLCAPRDVAYMHDEATRTLPELLHARGIEHPVLFGHSDGASIALIYAACYPDDVAALVLEAPHLFVEPVSVSSIAAIGATYREGPLRAKMERYHREVDRTFFGWNDIWLDERFRAWSVDVGAVRAPALAIQGIEDEYGTLAQLDALARGSNGPVDRLVLARCGHAPHRDRRPLVEEYVRDWLTLRV